MDPELINEFKSSWELFQKTNNELIKTKADGKSVADLEEKLAKINEHLDKLDELSQKMARLETANKRVILDAKGDPISTEQMEHKAAFQKWFRKGDQFKDELEKKALSVNDDSQGGYMVHADMSGRIVKKLFETSPIRQYASVTTISTDALEGLLDLDEAAGGWVGETSARGQSTNPKIGQWRIPTHEMFTQPAATQKLLDDAAWDAESWLAGKVVDKFARFENAGFTNGNGVTSPMGFTTPTKVLDDGVIDNWTATKRIGYIKTGEAADFPPVPSTGTAAAQGDPIINIVQSLKTPYREAQGTAFAMHRSTFGRVRRLRDNQGQYLWSPGLGGMPSTLMGYPVAEFNDMQLIGAGNFPIAFANWREAYQIVDRQGIRVLRDPYTAKPYVLFYTTKRTGGAVLNYEAIKFIKCEA